MFSLTNIQYDTLAELSTQMFCRRLAGAHKRYDASYFAAIGREGVEGICAEAIDHARRWSATDERSIWRISRIMTILGAQFLDDPLFPWTAAIVARMPFDGPKEVVNCLYYAATDYGRLLGGEDQTNYHRVYHRLAQLTMYDISASIASSENHQAGCHVIASLHPSKLSTHGSEAAVRQISDSLTRARRYSLGQESGAIAFALAGYLLNANFDQDPQFAPIFFPILSQQGRSDDISEKILRKVQEYYRIRYEKTSNHYN